MNVTIISLQYAKWQKIKADDGSITRKGSYSER